MKPVFPTLLELFFFDLPLKKTLLGDTINEFIKNNTAMLFNINKNKEITIREHHNLIFEVLDYSNYTNQTIEKLLSKRSQEPMDITNQNLFEFVYVKRAKDWGLYFKLSHLIGDAWSIGLLTDNIINGYLARLNNQEYPMLSSDYLKFIEMYHDKSGNFIVSSIHNNSKHLYTYAKVYDNRTVKIDDGISYKDNKCYGIDIDVFPIDGLPRDIRKSDKHFNKQKRWFRFYSYSISKYSKGSSFIKTLMKIATQFVSKTISSHRLINKINKNAMKHSFDSSEYIGASVTPYNGNKERIKKSRYMNQIKLMFEGDEYFVPKNYDEHLRMLYGDYLVLPPIEQQVTHHANKSFYV